MLQPSVLVDINRVPGLDRIVPHADRLEIGALARHAASPSSPDVAQAAPLLALALPHVAHPAVRNRGTHVLRGACGERRVAAEAFFLGLYETALAPNELLVRVEYPRSAGAWRYGFDEVSRRPVLVRATSLEEATAAAARLEVTGTSTYPAPYRRRLVQVLLERVLPAVAPGR